MSQYYSNQERESDPHALPDIEVFFAEGGAFEVDPSHGEEGFNEAGWYWQLSLDGEPYGPFKTEARALAVARAALEVRE